MRLRSQDDNVKGISLQVGQPTTQQLASSLGAAVRGAERRGLCTGAQNDLKCLDPTGPSTEDFGEPVLKKERKGRCLSSGSPG